MKSGESYPSAVLSVKDDDDLDSHHTFPSGVDLDMADFSHLVIGRTETQVITPVSPQWDMK